MKKNKEDINSNDIYSYTAAKGCVYWFDPLRETKVNCSPLVIVVSDKFHNQFADRLIVAVVSHKNAERVRPFFEVACELENKKIKVLVSCIHTVHKSNFFGKAKFLGKVSKETIKEINRKIKLILDLDS